MKPVRKHTSQRLHRMCQCSQYTLLLQPLPKVLLRLFASLIISALLSLVGCYAGRNILFSPQLKNATPSGNAPLEAKKTAMYLRFGLSTLIRIEYPVIVRSVQRRIKSPRFRCTSESRAIKSENPHAKT